MRRLILTACIMALAIPAIALAYGKTEKAIVEFKDPVMLQNVTLKGTYLIMHDENKMAAGLDCTYVYEYKNDERGKLVLSFHCIPVQRPRADGVTISSLLVDVNGQQVRQIREIQFKGSSEGHGVPLR